MSSIIHLLDSGESCSGNPPDCHSDVEHFPRYSALHFLDLEFLLSEGDDGKVVKTSISEMAPSHRRNLLVLLERKAEVATMSYFGHFMNGPFQPRGDMASLDMENVVDAAMDDPLEFVRGTRLYQALTYYVDLDEADFANDPWGAIA